MVQLQQKVDDGPDIRALDEEIVARPETSEWEHRASVPVGLIVGLRLGQWIAGIADVSAQHCEVRRVSENRMV